MAEEHDQGDKTELPSEHRIQEFRKKGDVAVSREMTSVVILATGLVVIGLSFSFIYEEFQKFVEWLYTLDATKIYEKENFQSIIIKTSLIGLKVVSPIIFSIMIVGIASIVSQIGLLFSTDVLKFDPQRINPISGLKRIFSMRSVVEAIKGFFKFLFIISIVYFYIKDKLNVFNGFYSLSFLQSVLQGKSFIMNLGFAIIGCLLVVALFDFGYQKFSYHKKLMMTKEEAKREHKEQEGNPEVRQKIKTIQKEMSRKRMMSEIPNADVIITNPTHISVAIQYDNQKMISPTVIAKGADLVALRIREIAKEHDIPIVENVPLARTLYKTVKIKENVPRNLYKAVAEVLAFVYKLKRSKKALS